MRKIVLLVSVVLLVMVLAGCAPDPRNVAEAEAIRLQAEQQAADAAQERLMAQDQHALDLAQAQAVQAETVAARGRLIRYGSMSGVIALVILLGASVYVYSSTVAPGLAQAAVTAADIKARCIPLDRATRAYPMLMTDLGGGRTALAIPGVFGVLPLDQAQVPNEQMAATLGQVQCLGLLVDAAKRSDQAGTLPMLQAPVIHAMDVKEVSPKVRVYTGRKVKDEQIAK